MDRMPPLLHSLVLVAGVVFVLCQCVVLGLWVFIYLAEGHYPRTVLGLLVMGSVVMTWHLTPLGVVDRPHTSAPDALYIFLRDDRPHRSEQQAVPPELHGREAPRDRQGGQGRDAGDLSGEWMMINTVWETQYAAYQHLQLGFRLWIRQQGQTFEATGEKYLENGRSIPAAARRRITIQGTLKAGGVIEATFVEAGRRRQTTGRLQLTRRDSQHLQGTFHSTAAGSSGASQWRRVQ
jgi:hypothetical protein